MRAAAKRKPAAAASTRPKPKRSSSPAPSRAGEAAAEWLPLARLRLWADNPRDNDGTPVSRVVESIKRFGFGAPIVARRANGEIIAGHTRFKASEALVSLYASAKPKERATWHADAVRIATCKEAPARLLDIGEREAHLLAVTDNRHTELTPWSDSLSSVLSDYSLEDAALAGWSEKDLEKLAKKFLDDDADVGGEGEGDGEPSLKCPGCGYELSDVFVRERVEKVIKKRHA